MYYVLHTTMYAHNLFNLLCIVAPTSPSRATLHYENCKTICLNGLATMLLHYHLPLFAYLNLLVANDSLLRGCCFRNDENSFHFALVRSTNRCSVGLPSVRWSIINGIFILWDLFVLFLRNCNATDYNMDVNAPKYEY